MADPPPLIPQRSPNPRLALVLGFLIAVGPVSVDMYLPAFGAIAREFGPSTPGLTLAAYFLGFAVGQLAFGVASDRYGRRLPFIVGLTIYTLGSLGCALSFSTASFCLWRAITAFGAAASIVIPRAYVRDLADGPPAAALMSQVLAIMSVAPILAPLLGSAVLSVLGWRAIFVLASGYGMASLILLRTQLPESLPNERRTALALSSMVRLYRDILGEREFVAYALIGSFGMGALFAYLAGAPTVFEDRYRFAPGQFGALMAIIGAATIAFFRLNTALVRSKGPRRMIVFGIAIWLAAALGLALCAGTETAGATAIFLCLVAFALGYSFIPSNSQVMALSRHQDHAATATSLMSALQYCSGAIAGAAVGAWADATAEPMAVVILICGLGAAAIAWLAPSKEDAPHVD